jgi:biopolymer transport protein ExbD
VLGFIALAPFFLSMCARNAASAQASAGAPVIAVPVGSVASARPSAPAPEVDAAPPPAALAGGAEEILVVTVAADGSLSVDGQRLASDDALLLLARASHDKNPAIQAIISADATVTYARVIHVLDLLKQAQISEIAFGMTPFVHVIAPPLPPASPPAFKGTTPTSCAELDVAIRRTLAQRACTSDAECTTGAQHCGCSQPISRAARSKLDALRGAFDAGGCAQKGPPRPCATCPPAPSVACAAGQCVARP